MNLRMGLAKNAVQQKLGKPLAEVNDSLIYNLVDLGYPIRIRIVFKDDKLNDVYLYRADF